MKPIVVATSFLAADLLRLGQEVRAVDQAVPIAIVNAARRSTAKPLNVPLMFVELECYPGDFAKVAA